VWHVSATPCQLHCRPKGRMFSVMLRDMVVDGTPCRPGRRDLCVSGRCRVSYTLLHTQRDRSWSRRRSGGGGSRRHPSSRVFPKKKMTAQSPPHPFLFFYLSRPSSFRFSPILGHRTPPMASPNPVMGSTAPTAGPGRARPLNNFCRILRQKVRFW